MTRKQQRGMFIAAGVGVLGLAVFLVFYALGDALVYYYTPSQIAEKGVKPGQRIRLGGQVGEGSVKRGEGKHLEFTITDGKQTTNVTYDRPVPNLFAEKKGAVVEGVFDAHGVFVADNVLAKHDENYMPRELTASLKKQGVWQGEGKNLPSKSPSIGQFDKLPSNIGQPVSQVPEAPKSASQ
jgi:cytochrome c-type biogenesis protein CcmE